MAKLDWKAVVAKIVVYTSAIVFFGLAITVMVLSFVHAPLVSLVILGIIGYPTLLFWSIDYLSNDKRFL